MRIDLYLAEKGLAESRSRAQAMIAGGMVSVNGKTVTKPAFAVTEADNVVLTDTLKFVSRGGEKLLGAIQLFGLNVSGLTCVDIGASTGGFTDCLLKNGAKHVYAVDCGTDQLHPLLRNDPRVTVFEQTNARTLSSELLGEQCELAVMDVSFISQTLLYPAVIATLTDSGRLISLIKPQFETTAMALGSGGILRNSREHVRVLEDVVKKAEGYGLTLTALARSPIKGGDGNREYLAVFGLGEDSKKQRLLLSKDFLSKLTNNQ